METTPLKLDGRTKRGLARRAAKVTIEVQDQTTIERAAMVADYIAQRDDERRGGEENYRLHTAEAYMGDYGDAVTKIYESAFAKAASGIADTDTLMAVRCKLAHTMADLLGAIY